MKHVHHLHHLIDDQKFKFVPDLGEIGHFEVAREDENMSKRETTTIEKGETSPHGTGSKFVSRKNALNVDRTEEGKNDGNGK
ncbi:MAG: hypothetical protein QXU98_13230 [Candidatus Parvarchaeota archaeon]